MLEPLKRVVDSQGGQKGLFSIYFGRREMQVPGCEPENVPDRHVSLGTSCRILRLCPDFDFVAKV